MDQETIVSSLLRSMSKGKRDRNQHVVQTLRNRQHLHKILERKAELATRGEQPAQQRLYEAETDVEVWSTGRREIQILLFVRSIRSSSPKDYSNNRLINGLTRLREINKENWKWGIDSTEKIKEKIAEKLKNWEETDRARRARNDELSLRQERNHTTVSQFLTQVQDLQNRVNS